MKRKLKVNDFFCGCGGMGIAFKNAGYEIAGAWDFDKYAVESYRANVGDHVQKADIKELHQADIPQADVWAFGFPCQDLSVAGKQRGMILKCEDCGEEIEINPEEYDANGNLLPPKENNKSDHTPGVQNLTPGKRTEGVTSKKLRKVARI